MNQEIITLLQEIRDELRFLNENLKKMTTNIPKNMPQVDKLTEMAMNLMKGINGGR